MNKNILIAGGTGLIGSRLVFLLKANYNIHILTRSKSRSEDGIHFHHWNLDKKVVEVDSKLEFDTIINLTGAGIADKRWTPQRKKILIESRTKSAALLSELLKTLENKPNLYLGASAIGFYGDRADELLTEESTPGTGFLAECCIAWEDAHKINFSHVKRAAILRIGIVLSNNGGALQKLKLPAKLGASGYFGNGKAYYPWIHIDDVCGMILQLIETKELSGFFNGTSLIPVSQKELAKGIKKAFAPYSIAMPIPAFTIKLAMGEMSDMLLLSSRVTSTKWEKFGFPYKYPTLDEALQDLKERDV